MKWLATTFLCLLAMPTLAEDENIPRGIVPFPSTMLCGVYNEGQKIEQEYGEIPFVEGDAQVMSPDPGKAYYGNIRIFLNPKTMSYTIFFDLGNDLTCLLTTGDKLQPAFRGERL